MEDIEFVGLTNYKDMDLDFGYSVCTLDFEHKITENSTCNISKVYCSVEGEIKNKLITDVIDSVGFVSGTLNFRIEYLNDDGKMFLNYINKSFSTEIAISKYVSKNVNINVDMYVNIFVNSVFLRKINANTMFISCFLTTALEII